MGWIALRKEQADVLAKMKAGGGGPGLVATGEQLKALRAKYGFSHDALEQWNRLGEEILSAHPLDNPMVASSVAMMHQMQQQGGDAKASADQYFKQQDDNAKQAETRGHAKFGDACWAFGEKHATEIIAVELSSATTALGVKSPPAAPAK